jgi:thioredoxin 1
MKNMSEHVRETSDSSFDADVLQSERPVLVDFWAEWCAPCKALNPAVEAVAAKYAATARVVKMNIDDNPLVAQRYGIRGLPTLILFKGGHVEDRIVGAISKDSIARLIDKHTSASTGA